MSLKLLPRSLYVKIYLCVFADFKIISDTFTASKQRRELRLISLMADICRADRSNEIDNIVWISTSQHIDDNFSSSNRGDILQNSTKTGRLLFTIEQWVNQADLEKQKSTNVVI